MTDVEGELSRSSGDAYPPAGSMAAGTTRSPNRRRRSRMFTGLTGIAVGYLVLLVLAAVIGPLLMSGGSAYDISVSAQLQGPSAQHWLGTDELGRDVLARLIYGARISLISSIIPVAIGLVIGVGVGLVAGYSGGWRDQLVMRACDILQSIPMVLVAFAIVGLLGPGLNSVMVAVGVLFSASFARLSRALALAAREKDFVSAALVLGLPRWRIALRYVLLNIADPLIVQTALLLGVAQILVAGLSYLGLGVEPGTASWGGMLSTGQVYQGARPLLTIAPGLAIVLTVLACNLVGDGFRGVLGGRAVATRRRPATARSTASSPARHTPPGTATLARPGADGGDPAGSPAGTRDDAALLEVRHLTVAAPGADGAWVEVVSDVSFDVRAGQRLGLVGESGSGKSLTAAAIVDLLPPPVVRSAGQILFNGLDLGTLPDGRLAAMRGKDFALVTQDPMAALSPAHTIGRQLSETLRAHQPMSASAARSASVELLALVGVANPAERVDAYPHQFSGGMAQRVVIASAIACKPTLLIADEPTTALDVRVQKQILELLNRLSVELGMALILISHDLGVVAETCEQVAVMYAGQIVEFGGTRQVFDHPRHPYTSALMTATPRYAPRQGRLATIPGAVPPPWDWPLGCRFAPRCGFAEPRCTDPEASVLVSGVRCVRSGELTLPGVSDGR